MVDCCGTPNGLFAVMQIAGSHQRRVFIALHIVTNSILVSALTSSFFLSVYLVNNESSCKAQSNTSNVIISVLKAELAGLGRDLRKGITCYINNYNNERPHETLDYHYPADIYLYHAA